MERSYIVNAQSLIPNPFSVVPLFQNPGSAAHDKIMKGMDL